MSNINHHEEENQHSESLNSESLENNEDNKLISGTVFGFMMIIRAAIPLFNNLRKKQLLKEAQKADSDFAESAAQLMQVYNDYCQLLTESLEFFKLFENACDELLEAYQKINQWG